MKKPTLTKPKVGGDINIWGDKLNLNVEAQDAFNSEVAKDLGGVSQEIKRLGEEKLDKTDVKEELTDVVKQIVDEYILEDVTPTLDNYMDTTIKPSMDLYAVGIFDTLDNDVITKLKQLDNHYVVKVDDLLKHVDNVLKPRLDLYTDDKKNSIGNYVDVTVLPLINKTVKEDSDAYVDEEVKPSLDAYTKTKEAVIEKYVQDALGNIVDVKTDDIDKHVEEVNKPSLDAYVNTKKLEINSFVSEDMELVLYEYAKRLERDLDAFIVLKKVAIDDYVELKKIGLDNYVESKLGWIDDFIAEKSEEFWGVLEPIKAQLEEDIKIAENALDSHTQKKLDILDQETLSKKAIINHYAEIELERLRLEGVDGKQDTIDEGLNTPSKHLVTAINNLAVEMDDKVDGAYVDEENNLILTASGVEIVSVPIPEGGGGGGGGGTTGLQRNVRITNHLPSKNVSAGVGEDCFLEFTFVSQERYSSDEPYENTEEKGTLEISIKNNTYPSYTVMHRRIIQSGERIKLNVAEYLITGTTQIMLKVAGEVTEITTPAFVYTVTVSSLVLYSDTFSWWDIFDKQEIFLPVRVGGNLSKLVEVIVRGNGYEKEYEYNLGYSTYLDTSYNIYLDVPPTSGIYTIEIVAKSQDGNIRTRKHEYNIICLAEDKSGKYVIINNVDNSVENWASSKIGEMCCYDGGRTTTGLDTIILQGNRTVYTMVESSIPTATKRDVIINLEVDTSDNANFTADLHMRTGDKEEIDPISLHVSNSNSFAPEPGSVMIINPKNRSNGQSNRQKIVNESNGSEVEATWTHFNWINDGWVTDMDGEKVLRVRPQASVEINYNPFANEVARSGLTIEIDMATRDAQAYELPVLQLSNREIDDRLVGIKITPDKVTMCSQAKKNIEAQSKYFEDDKRQRFTFVISPNTYGYPGFNLCTLYIDGVKNRSFAYENNDYFYHPYNLLIGSPECSIDIYAVRVYDLALSSDAVLRNYVSLLTTAEEKNKVMEKNDIYDILGETVDFENVKRQYNCLVFDNEVPSYTDATRRDGTLELFYADKPEWNSKVTLANARGQGTTAMFYWIWNTRYHISNNSEIEYADGSYATGRVWQWYPGAQGGERFTAKKNFASPMHSHKMGSVASFHDVYKKLGYKNDTMKTAEYANARVAVEQLPFFHFEKKFMEGSDEPTYIFRGLVTFGSDKGDKITFGFDNKIFPDMLSIEGSDNAPLLTLFRVPWNKDRVFLDEDGKYITYNGINCWEVAIGKEAQCDGFIEAYECAYGNSNRIRAFNGTLSQLHLNTDSLKYEPYEFWIGLGAEKYNLYYYEASLGMFIPSTIQDQPVNLYDQLVNKGLGLTDEDLNGLTVEQQNDLFIQARLLNFRNEAPKLWNIEECLYFMNTIEFNGGTDERAKNTYPYRFDANGLFSFRADDMDTRFDITNRGLANKPYWVEFWDTDEHGTPYWNGLTSNLWTLLEFAFPDEKRANMVKVIDAMISLSGANIGDEYYKLTKFYEKYFWSLAQQYFPQSAYNVDMKIMQEDAKIAYLQGVYANDTDPIEQALGDHYTSSLRWVNRRILYMMSKYSYGMFSADGVDTIVVRASGNVIDYDITPAIDMYPAISNGITIVRGQRTKANEVCKFHIDLAGSGDQQNAIQGVQYIKDIGAWHNKNVNGSMLVRGRRLTDLNLGHKTEPIIINISSLTVSGCTSLKNVNISNIATLRGTLDLSGCGQLTNLYADGTKLTQIKLPEGGILKHVEFGDSIQYLSLSNQLVLSRENLDIEACKWGITDLVIQNCKHISPIDLVIEILEKQKQLGTIHLKKIRAIDFDVTYENGDILDLFHILGNGNFQGLDADGVAISGYPVLQGTIRINSFAYIEDILVVTDKFPSVEVIPKGYAKKFEDKEVERVLITAIDNDKDNFISPHEMEEAVVYGSFKDNKVVTKFNELYDFPKITRLDDHSFENSTIQQITLPKNVTDIGSHVFNNCEKLTHIYGIETATSLGAYAFRNCENLSITKIHPSITRINRHTFESCRNLTINLDDYNITSVGDYAFSGTAVTLTKLPKECGFYSFSNCRDIKADEVINNTEDLSVLEEGLFEGCSCSDVGHIHIAESISSIQAKSLHVTGLKSIEFTSKNVEISLDTFNTTDIIDIYVPWSIGEKDGAPWGAINANIHYDCKKSTEWFEDKNIQDYIDEKYYPITMHNSVKLKAMEYFGFEGLPTSSSVSWFAFKTINSWVGMDIFENLRGFTIKDSNCNVETVELVSKKLVSLHGALQGCLGVTHLIIRHANELVDLENVVLYCSYLNLVEIPPRMPKVSTTLDRTCLDKEDRTIYYLEDPSVSEKGQLTYHSEESTNFVLANMDYSRLEMFHAGPINEIFECTVIANYIKEKTGKSSIYDIVTMSDLDTIRYFGSSNLVTTSGTQSDLYGKTITSFKGCRYLRKIRNIYLYNCTYVGGNIIDFSGSEELVSLYRAFNNMGLPEGDYTFLINTANVTDMSYMFYGSRAITLELNNWDTRKVTNMSYMFCDSQATTLEIGNWDTSSVTNMRCMFQGSRAITLELNNWDTSNVIDMTYMFYSSQATTLEIGNWDTSNVTNMERMFQSLQATTLKLNNWDVSKVTNMRSMFSSSRAITLELNNWDTSNVIDMTYMFYSSQATTLEIGNWDTSNVISMISMFDNSRATILELNNWDTSNVTNMSYMFYSSRATTLEIGNWDTSNVTNMERMFYSSRATTLEIGNWDTSSVTNMRSMFRESYVNILELNNWDTSNVTHMISMFYDSRATTLEIGNWDTSNVIDMENMFYKSRATTLEIGNWDVGNVISMISMFDDSQVTTLKLNNWDTGKVTNMRYMFCNSRATTLEIGNWDTSNVTTMLYMFYNSRATILELNNWDTRKVTNMERMFQGLQATTLEIGNWDTSSVTNMLYMFYQSQITTIILPTSFPIRNTVSNTLSSISLDKEGRTVIYAKNDAVTSRSQIRYHNSEGVAEYTLCTLDYSKLPNLSVKISELFKDAEIARHIAYKLDKSVDSTTTLSELGSIEVFGLDTLTSIPSSSLFSDKVITTFDGCETLVGLKQICLRGAVFTQDIDITFGTTPLLTNLSGMLGVIDSNVNVTLSFDTSKVSSLAYMLFLSNVSIANINELEFSSVEDMSYMFNFYKVDTINFKNPTTCSVLNCSNMFADAISTTINLQGFNTTSVTSMSYMFRNVKATVLDVGCLAVNNVTDMTMMFNGVLCTSVNLEGWDTSNLSTINNLFSNASCEILGLGGLNTSNVTNMSYAFSGYRGNTTLDIGEWDTSNVKNMSYMLQVSQVKLVDISGWDTSSVTNMTSLFKGSSLESIDISNWDTSSVLTMYYMFGDAKASTIDLGNIDTTNVTNTRMMFYGALVTDLIIPTHFPVQSTNDTAFHVIYIDAKNRNIIYSENDSITQKSQIRFHDSGGVPEYFLSNLDYSRLRNLPSVFMVMALSGDDYPDQLREDTYDTLKINGVNASSKSIENIKKGEFQLPSEGRYEFERYCDGCLVDHEIIVCLYSKNMSYSLENITEEDLDHLK